MKKLDKVHVALILSPMILLIMAGLGVFGDNCQQTSVDVLNDMRSTHVIIHD